MQQRHCVKSLVLSLVVGVGLVFANGVLAQMGPPGSPPEPQQAPGPQMEPGPPMEPQIGALQMEYLELQERVLQVQNEAFEEEPALQEEAEALEEMIVGKMEEAGFDPQDIMETLLAAQAMLQDPATTDAERMAIMQSVEVQEAQQQLQQAQQVVAQDQEVAEAQETFEDNVMTAMREVDPEIDDVLERLEALQFQMQQGQR